MNRIFKYIFKYPIEFIFFVDFFILFKILPLDLSRSLGSFIATNIGPMLPVNKIVRKNLLIAFPSKEKNWHIGTEKKIWHNFGCILAEYAHMKEILNKRISVIEDEHSNDFFNNDKNILVSAHSSNWEVPGMSCNIKSDKVSGIVREPNNPLIRYFLSMLRKKYSVRCFSKDIRGTKNLIKQFQNGDSIALLADQQLSSGVETKFFNKDAKITSLPAQLALKFKCKIFLAWPIRKENNDFEFRFFQSITTKDLEDNQKNIDDISNKINEFFEEKISKYPDQYFWLHNRWKL